MEMGKLEFGDARSAWGGEAAAFTPLLAADDMLEYLGEETGIGPLSLIEVEHATAGNRSLDILAETSAGERVAIENQYSSADHDHLTRGLAYAVAADCRALVLVAEDHRDEFVAVADYLNQVASLDVEHGVLVWLVRVRAVRRVGDDIWSPEFVVRARPNEWAAKVRRETPEKMQSLEDFYRKCSPDWADSARRFIERWLALPGGREFHNSINTVALYLPTVRKENPGTCVIQLGSDGECWICRRYLWQHSGAFNPDSEPEELDHLIRTKLPDTEWVGKHAFLRANPSNDAIWEVVEWLTDRLLDSQKASE